MPQLAQANVAALRAPLDDPSMREFVAALDPVHRRAERSDGFVWRLRTGDEHGVCVVREDAGPALLNVSVWRDYASLLAFVYRSGHGQQVRRRGRWFDPAPQPSTVLWWVPDGVRPTVEDATLRLRYLRIPTVRRRARSRCGGASRRPVRR